MKEHIPKLVIGSVITFPLFFMLMVAYAFKVGWIATTVFAMIYLVPVLVFIMLARDDFMFRIKMQFLRRMGYIALEIVEEDLRKRRVPVQPKNGKIIEGDRIWRFRPDKLIFASGIPTQVVNSTDSMPLDLLCSEERTLMLDPAEIDNAPVQNIPVGLDDKNKELTEEKKVLRISDIRPAYRPTDFFNDVVEAAQNARILGPSELKIILIAAAAAAVLSLVGIVIAFNSHTAISDLTLIVQALPK